MLPILVSIIVSYGDDIYAGGNSWQLGDWLINYKGGPVRRGLSGQLLMFISDLGVDLKWLTFAVQSFIYMATFQLVSQIYCMRQRSGAWCLLLFSPAFLLFPYFSWLGGFRKETILFLSFALIAYFYAQKRLGFKPIVIGYCIYTIAAFSHELAVFALPFYFYLFYRSAQSGILEVGAAWRWSLLFLLTAALALAFALRFPGERAVVGEICNSLLARGFDYGICTGAIEWLRFDLQYAVTSVFAYWPRYISYYPVLLALALVPVLFTNALRGPMLVLFAVGFLALLPLFLVALDWGRWIGIYTFFVFVVILSESVSGEVEIRPVPIWVVLAYLGTWSVPHCCEDRPGFGWAEVFATQLKLLD